MVTIDNIGIGVSKYIDEEIAPKVDGLKKWAVSLASVIVVAKITEMFVEHKETLKSIGYITEDGMVDDSKIISDLKRVAHDKGAVTQQLPYVGSFRFDESDIDMLGRYLHG